MGMPSEDESPALADPPSGPVPGGAGAQAATFPGAADQKTHERAAETSCPRPGLRLGWGWKTECRGPAFAGRCPPHGPSPQPGGGSPGDFGRPSMRAWIGSSPSGVGAGSLLGVLVLGLLAPGMARARCGDYVTTARLPLSPSPEAPQVNSRAVEVVDPPGSVPVVGHRRAGVCALPGVLAHGHAVVRDRTRPVRRALPAGTCRLTPATPAAAPAESRAGRVIRRPTMVYRPPPPGSRPLKNLCRLHGPARSRPVPVGSSGSPQAARPGPSPLCRRARFAWPLPTRPAVPYAGDWASPGRAGPR
jgi:hypothetical protein